MSEINTKKNVWRVYCPNCRNMLIGYAGNDGKGKVTCRECRVTVVRTPKTRRRIFLDVYYPEVEDFDE